MITRRSALRSLALTTGALAFTSPLLRSQDAAVTKDAEGVFKLPALGYDYDALEPFIDAETMKLHHDKHHAAYVSRLNQAVATVPGLETKTIEEILAAIGSIPENARQDIRNHGGGHANHALFWQTLKKSEGGVPVGEVAAALNLKFQTFAIFQEQFNQVAMSVFGSGWAWLVLREGSLIIEKTSNQDSPLMTGGFPLLGVDVWEHAYYLKHQNRRAEYLAAFQNVINWEFVSERYQQAMAKPPAPANPA